MDVINKVVFTKEELNVIQKVDEIFAEMVDMGVEYLGSLEMDRLIDDFDEFRRYVERNLEF